MPRATIADATVSAPLTQMSVANIQESKFVASRVFPILPVMEQSGTYFEFNRADLLRTDARSRTPGAESAGKTFGLSQSTYTAAQSALHFDLADEIRKTQGSPLANDEASVKIVSQDLAILRDQDWVNGFFIPGLWSTDLAGAGVNFVSWNNAAATIVADVLSWKTTVKLASGVRPNVCVMTSDVWDVVQEDPTIVDRVKHTSNQPVTEEIVANLFGVEEIVILDTITTTSEEGAAATTTANVAVASGAAAASQRVMLAYRTPSPALMSPSAGYIFSWSDFDSLAGMDSAAGAPAIKRYRMENLASDRYEGFMYYEMRIVAASSGLLSYNVLS